jgi:hypothetical protein
MRAIGQFDQQVVFFGERRAGGMIQDAPATFAKQQE